MANNLSRTADAAADQKTGHKEHTHRECLDESTSQKQCVISQGLPGKVNRSKLAFYKLNKSKDRFGLLCHKYLLKLE
ncbi:MAG: hypothetical protein ACD_34C00175G0001 [uncultured bacterium]|nr:MAG: hypothetical protein ACD_34C00175G0001 [uncultured bacterium]